MDSVADSVVDSTGVVLVVEMVEMMVVEPEVMVSTDFGGLDLVASVV